MSYHVEIIPGSGSGISLHLIQCDVESSALQNLHLGLLHPLHPSPPWGSEPLQHLASYFVPPHDSHVYGWGVVVGGSAVTVVTGVVDTGGEDLQFWMPQELQPV